jgi:hypothetical protein
MEAAVTSELQLEIRLITRKHPRNSNFQTSIQLTLTNYFPKMHCNIFVTISPFQRFVSNHPEPKFIVSERQLPNLKNVSEKAIFKDDLLLKRLSDGWIKCEREDNVDNFNTYCIRSVNMTLSMLALNCRLIARDRL